MAKEASGSSTVDLYENLGVLTVAAGATLSIPPLTNQGTIRVTGILDVGGICDCASTSFLTGGTLIREELGIQMENLSLDHLGRAKKITAISRNDAIIEIFRLAFT